jgi:hypothetical protein
MSRVTVAAGIVAAVVTLSIATAKPSPAPPPDDCQVTGQSDGSVSPEIMAENYRISKQICEDLARRDR